MAVALPIAAIALHLGIVACFARKWDKVAAVTVLPFWFWGLLGIALAFGGWVTRRSRFAAIVGALWVVTIIVGSDETRGIMRVWKPALPETRPADENGKKILRVATINCNINQPEAADEVLRFSPDVVFLQESPPINKLQAMAKKLYGDEGSALGGWHCGIIARGKLTQKFRLHEPRLLLATLEQPDGKIFDLACVHLGSAPTRIDFWNRESWKLHYTRRIARRNNLTRVLRETGNHLGGNPLIFGGDFNASPHDAVFRLIDDDWTDAWEKVGRGWGNTFNNRLPSLRIDRLFVSEELRPTKAQVFRTRHSDHRMLVADFAIE